MNHDINDFDQDAGNLPADLRMLGDALDALGSAERSAAPSSLTDRVFAAAPCVQSGDTVDVRPIADGLDRLGEHEADHAPTRLEAVAFELSREAIAGGRAPVDRGEPALRLSRSAPEIPQVVVRPRFAVSGRMLALAAALGLCGVGIAVFQATRSGTVPVQPESSIALAERVDREFSSLFEVMDTSYGESASVGADSDHGIDTGWLEELYGQESL